MSGVPAVESSSVEVAGDNAATEEVAADITFSEVSGLEGANESGTHQTGKRPTATSSILYWDSFLKPQIQLEGTATSNLGEDAIVAPIVKAEVDPKSPEADTSEIAASVQPETQNSGLIA